MDLTSIEFIQKLLVDSLYIRDELKQHPLAFFVHASVIGDFLKVWHKFITITKWEIYEFDLQIGTRCFDMRIIYVTLINDADYATLQKLIDWSQFSFPWQDNPTLFISLKSFKDLQYFIRTHDLEEKILKIDEIPGINMNDEIIKVVTFNESAKALNIFQKYEDHLKSAVTQHRQSYFMTLAFPWLQEWWMQHFKIELESDFYTAFYIVLNHLGSLNYMGELNLFDLIAIRFALCDVRNLFPSRNLEYEIDFMIKRELRKIVTNGHLDLDQYAIEKNNTQIYHLISYFVYEFQNYFKTVNSNSKYFAASGLEACTCHSSLYLSRENDIFNQLKQKSNIQFGIDGSNYDQMSLSLFLDIIECKNVNGIVLDTNYRWIQNECELRRTISNTQGSFAIHISKHGKNTFNCIEDFVSSLKTITLLSGTITLYIDGGLKDYTIFNNLTVNEIVLSNTIIDGRMLDELHKTNLKTKISFYNITIESKPNNWTLLTKLLVLKWAEIREDEGIWQSLFDFVLDEMLNTNTKEFQFEADRIVVMSNDRRISLFEIKFTIDELNAKLEIRNKYDNQIVDFYNTKFKLSIDDKSDYDFYQ